ncbi:MAG TPA: hypothetical protein VJQ43_01220, partial [Thermoplasmata archaeon]|nr:hypothetical protein [Thermoplasmata archaeon]
EGALGPGPVALGVGASARGARLGPYVTLSAGVVVEPEAHLEDAVVMEGAVIGKGARVVRSILGPRARVAPGHTVEGSVLGAGAEA